MLNSYRLFRNALMAICQTVVSGLMLFFLYRYLIDRLGAEQLGLWTVILSSTSVAKLSEMGLAGSVVKFVARYRAAEDEKQASEIIQTAAISIASVMAVLLVAVYPLLDNLLRFVIPNASIVQATAILPWAFCSLWLGSVAGAFQSGLDGCQRMDVRHILMMCSNLFFFASALWLVPQYGLTGLAISQVAQALFLLVGSWLLLRHQLHTLPVIPLSWSREKFREMFAYATNFQLNAMALMLFEPITKMLMTRYGGLESAAYYEMAYQVVIKLRALLVSANQALVPAVAELSEASKETICDVYLKTYRLVFFFVLPFYTAIFISLPVVSVLWLGYLEPQFIIFGALLTPGWALNNLTVPAYFTNLGTGHLKWNSISHILMTVSNFALSFALGAWLGGLGVAISAILSLIAGSITVMWSLHKRYEIPLRRIVPKEHLFMSSVVLVSAGVSIVMNETYVTEASVITSNAVFLGLYFAVIAVVMWTHPYRIIIQDRVLRYSKRDIA